MNEKWQWLIKPRPISTEIILNSDSRQAVDEIPAQRVTRVDLGEDNSSMAKSRLESALAEVMVAPEPFPKKKKKSWTGRTIAALGIIAAVLEGYSWVESHTIVRAHACIEDRSESPWICGEPISTLIVIRGPDGMRVEDFTTERDGNGWKLLPSDTGVLTAEMYHGQTTVVPEAKGGGKYCFGDSRKTPGTGFLRGDTFTVGVIPCE